MRSTLLSAAVLLAAARLGAAQTYTDCNPMKNTSCPSDPALGKTITVDFTKGASDQFTLADGTSLTYGDNGAEFVMKSETDAPTISSAWYIFWGTVSVITRAAPGTGIVSSFILESDDLDEVDWEWLGGDSTEVETNYFGKGNTTTYNRATYVKVATSPQDDFHNYTIDWSKDWVKWYVDDALVRTLDYADANGGSNFPQTPMRVKMGNWDGGASTEPEGTVQWAGGHSDFSNGKTYTMYVKSVTITDGTTSGSEYTYGDETGSYESIKVSGSSGGAVISSSASSSSASKTASASKSASTGATATKSSGSSSTSSSDPSSESSGSSSGSSGSSSGSSAASSAAAGGFSQGSVTTSASSTTHTGAAAAIRPSKYGKADYAVGALGLALGYLVM